MSEYDPILISGRQNPFHYRLDLTDNYADLTIKKTDECIEKIHILTDYNTFDQDKLLGRLIHLDHADIDFIIDKIKKLTHPLTGTEIFQMVTERGIYDHNREVRNSFRAMVLKDELLEEHNFIVKEAHKANPTELDNLRILFEKLRLQLEYAKTRYPQYSESNWNKFNLPAVAKLLAPTLPEMTRKLQRRDRSFFPIFPQAPIPTNPENLSDSDFYIKHCLQLSQELLKNSSSAEERDAFLRTYLEVVLHNAFDTKALFNLIVMYGSNDLIFDALNREAAIQSHHLAFYLQNPTIKTSIKADLRRTYKLIRWFQEQCKLSNELPNILPHLYKFEIEDANTILKSLLRSMRLDLPHVPEGKSLLLDHLSDSEILDELRSEKNFSHRSLFDQTKLAYAWEKYLPAEPEDQITYRGTDVAIVPNPQGLNQISPGEAAAFEHLIRLITVGKTNLIFDSNKTRTLMALYNLVKRPLGRALLLAIIESNIPIIIVPTTVNKVVVHKINSKAPFIMAWGISNNRSAICSTGPETRRRLPFSSHVELAHEFAHILLSIRSSHFADKLSNTKPTNPLNKNLNEQFAMIVENRIRAEFGEYPRTTYLDPPGAT